MLTPGRVFEWPSENSGPICEPKLRIATFSLSENDLDARQVGDGDFHPPRQFGQHHLAFFPPTTEKMYNPFSPSMDLPPSREAVKCRIAP